MTTLSLRGGANILMGSPNLVFVSAFPTHPSKWAFQGGALWEACLGLSDAD